MNTTKTSAFMAALVRPCALTDSEVREELRAEMQHERATIDKAMAQAISEGRRRTFYLSTAIFDPLDKIEKWLARAQIALARDPDPKTRPFIQNALQQQSVELEVARRLRALRAPINHMDPPDYWEALRRQASAAPIQRNHNCRDAA